MRRTWIPWESLVLMMLFSCYRITTTPFACRKGTNSEITTKTAGWLPGAQSKRDRERLTFPCSPGKNVRGDWGRHLKERESEGGSLSLVKCVPEERLGKTRVVEREELLWSAMTTALISTSWWGSWATGLSATPPCLESTLTWLTPQCRTLLSALSITTDFANNKFR